MTPSHLGKSQIWPFPRALKISLNAMEPTRSMTCHIPDKAASDVYLLEQSSNTRFLNNRIPPLVVIENHSDIHDVYKQLT